jgi:hypothetical protein
MAYFFAPILQESLTSAYTTFHSFQRKIATAPFDPEGSRIEVSLDMHSGRQVPYDRMVNSIPEGSPSCAASLPACCDTGHEE